MNSVVLGGGCFWCLEAYFQQLKGVVSVVPGYAGGNNLDPNYESVCAGDGHAEVVKIQYDESVISLETILNVFFAMHDPTTLNRQGHDKGLQYRSILLYEDTAQKLAFESAKESAQMNWDDAIVTEIKPLDSFYEAESYHHNYFVKHPEQAYCQVIINPKLSVLRKKFSQLLM